MAEFSGEVGGGDGVGGEFISGIGTVPAANSTPTPPPPLAVSGSFKEGKSSSSRRRGSMMRPSLDSDEFMNLLHGSDPVKVELNRLENEVRDKDRELEKAHAEIKGLRFSERLREKAVEELTDELSKVDEKLKLTESLLESKNLEIKKINDEKKASMAAQFAAEATLRRVHAAQKDDDMPPIEAILAPLEAELKLARQEIAKLQDDNKALDRLTKSKEAALLEAERTVQVALAKASMVDDLQNKNQELMKQIEICQEENKILDKMHRQKVAEVEKLTQTVRELEEAVLAGGAAANAVRDYQRKVQEMNEERKTLDRELARAKVTANRVAVVVANEWKDANDKVMPVKQWLEERRFLQGEMQNLRDKLTVAERAAKSEAQLKEKFHLRLKVLEESLRGTSNSSKIGSADGRSASNGSSRRQSIGGADNMSKLTSNGFLSKRTPSLRSLSSSTSSVLKHAKGTSKSFDGGTRSLDRGKVLSNGGPSFSFNQSCDATKDSESPNTWKGTSDDKPTEFPSVESEDSVPGILYDLLQKEVVALRKSGHEKDQSLKDKDDAIEMLAKKVDTLTKAMEVEAKKMRREVAAMEKEVAAMRVEKDHEHRAKRFGNPKPSVNSTLLAGRSMGRGGLTRSTQ
ncbi:microtubule-associated protein 70-1 isoform X2 [Cannabis sativa]|uniref:microtubule-associated protein 70-1 isoform X2 n=1 Tax=Cannabis sativa TaxID=3483 RepID=UPI0029C9ECCF|nr:microtubule-associated protein 70-1 isoform X2 [Cannabis sativa]